MKLLILVALNMTFATGIEDFYQTLEKLEGKDFMLQLEKNKSFAFEIVDEKIKSCKNMRKGRNLCRNELEELRVKLNDSFFKGELKYLDYLHKVRVEKLTHEYNGRKKDFRKYKGQK